MKNFIILLTHFVLQNQWITITAHAPGNFLINIHILNIYILYIVHIHQLNRLNKSNLNYVM